MTNKQVPTDNPQSSHRNLQSPATYPSSAVGRVVGGGLKENLRVRLNIPAEGRSDRIRRYELKYSQSPGSEISLLTKIVQYGTGDSAFLPPLELTYSQFDPKGSYRRMKTDMGAPPASLADPNCELADVNGSSPTPVRIGCFLACLKRRHCVVPFM